jgi:hypothetical protein
MIIGANFTYITIDYWFLAFLIGLLFFWAIWFKYDNKI